MKRSTYVIIGVVLAVLVGLLVLAQSARTRASALESAARAGKAQASEAVRLLAAEDATGAASQFAEAQKSFAQADELMGPDWFAGAVKAMPYAGRQYAAAESLVAIGQDGSKAGFEMASLLAESSAAEGAGEGGVNALLQSGHGRIVAALDALSDARERDEALTDEGLVEPLAEQVRALKRLLREKIPNFERSGAVLALTNALIRTESRILVVSQNSAELRPTGGFAGSYGIISAGPKGIRLETYKDVYTLPNPPGKVTPPPGAAMTRDFQFRDANWWLDYPTSARTMLEMWRTLGQPDVDGIIAIDVVVMRDLLELFEPIEVPSFAETFTSDNLLERLTYLIEVQSSGERDRKDVLVALANELEKRMLKADVKKLSKVASVLSKAANAKHIQMYFVDPKAQQAAVELGWSGSIAAQPETTDLLGVANAMNRPGKTNLAMSKRIDYQVELLADGSAETTAVLRYANSGRLPVREDGMFSNYLRVYRLTGTQLTAGDAEKAVEQADPNDVDLPKVVREFVVAPGAKHTEVITTTVPNAWRTGGATNQAARPAGETGAARQAAGYRLQLVRQADLQDVPTTIAVTPPPGWTVAAARARRTASGEKVPVKLVDGSVRGEFPLTGDITLDVELVSD